MSVTSCVSLRAVIASLTSAWNNTSSRQSQTHNGLKLTDESTTPNITCKVTLVKYISVITVGWSLEDIGLCRVVSLWQRLPTADTQRLKLTYFLCLDLRTFLFLSYAGAIIIFIRPHCSTTYVDASCCYRSNSVVCLSVSLSQQ